MDTTTIQDRMQACQNNENAVRFTSDQYGLPLGHHLALHEDSIHIYTADIDVLSQWLDITGGHIDLTPAGPDSVMRTLHTFTDPWDGHTGIPVLVHVLMPADELVMPEITAATLRSTAATLRSTAA